MILARLSRSREHPVSVDDLLQIWVRDTGAGASEAQLAEGLRHGVGLSNVEQRIRRHFGESGLFNVRSAPGIGTTVELGLPFDLSIVSVTAQSGAAVQLNPGEDRHEQPVARRDRRR
ncbi:MAG TPA: ATP-binding protein [Blastocatellia bacterium]|nr:ATP-binding protein [Blastocatellia bacterium]